MDDAGGVALERLKEAHPSVYGHDEARWNLVGQIYLHDYYRITISNTYIFILNSELLNYIIII